MSAFAFRMRAYAAAHMDYDNHLRVTWPGATAILQSEYTGGEAGRAYPVTLHGEIRGSAESLDDAQHRLAAMLGNSLSVLALASNAAIADPLALAAYGLDLSTPQPFIWYQTPAAADWFPPGERRFEPEPMERFMAAVGSHPQYALLHRAIEAYRRALSHWTPEGRLLAGEFLYIAAETLSRCILETEAADAQVTPKRLAKLRRAQTSEVYRLRVLHERVFGGDDAAREAMEEASNGFEHGYMAADDVRTRIVGVLDRAMGLVRRALIAAASPDAETERILLADAFAEPRGLVSTIQVVLGELSVTDPQQVPPAAGEVRVELEWPRGPIKAERTPAGGLVVTVPSNVKVLSLPPNTTLSLSGAGLRAANVGAYSVEAGNAEEAELGPLTDHKGLRGEGSHGT
ncbi:MAG: hypothetical protein QOD86_1010, partial [Miltoncostaeaceae bacterium]|nr:hypothetical protein [Miltoncostaeaceae bacterium]